MEFSENLGSTSYSLTMTQRGHTYTRTKRHIMDTRAERPGEKTCFSGCLIPKTCKYIENRELNDIELQYFPLLYIEESNDIIKYDYCTLQRRNSFCLRYVILY